MSGLEIALVGLLVALLLGALGLPIGVAIGLVGVAGIWFIAGPGLAITNLQTLPYSMTSQYAFVVVPMFVLMGAITSETGITQSLFTAANRLLQGMRGALLHATTLASAGFAAISGSTVVNAALFTRVAMPEMIRLGYDRATASGCIAAAGTLAALIPPSLSFVIYGILTNEPIGELLIAGIVPGLLTTVAYMAGIGALLKWRPQIAPAPERKLALAERFDGMAGLWPVLALAAIVIGGIYTGLMTPSAAGAVGAAGAILISLAQRKLRPEGVRNALRTTAVTTSSLFLVVIGGLLFTRFLLLSGAVTESTEALVDANLSGPMFLIALVIVYFILGMFMDPTSMLVMTLPFVYPLIKALGYDGVWFGVIVVKLVEIAVITPPVGMNLFAVVSASDGRVKMAEVYRGIWPFVLIECLLLAALLVFPELSLWLPRMMFG